MTWWLLASCVDTLTTPSGDERVRGALWIEAPLVSNEEDALVIVSNTPIPCEAEQVADDPNTPADETAGALEWWEAQLGTAATREGSVILALWLTGGVTESEFEIDYLGDRDGWAVAYRVVESVLEARDGPYFYYEVSEWETEQDLSGNVTVVRSEAAVRVTANLDDWATDAEAERCDNTVLVRAFYEYIVGAF